MGDKFGFREYIDIVFKYKKSVLAITAAVVAVSVVLNFFVLEPMYEASSTVMVKIENQDGSKIDYDDIVLNQKLAITYGKIAKSKTVLRKTMENLKVQAEFEQFSDSVKVDIYEGTEILEITVLNKSPRGAEKIANEITRVFMSEVSRIMDVENINVIDYAEIPQDPVKPKKKLNVAVSGILGMTIGLLVVFLKEYLDDTIKTPEDVEKYLGIQVMGTVPDFEKAGKKRSKR